MGFIGFNPRAREGRDVFAWRLKRFPARFNPRAREGRDAERKLFLRNLVVSIHAPARGATFLQPCAAAGAVFQSTRPRGARRV